MTSLEDQSPGVDLKLSDFLDGVVPSIVVFNAAGRVVFANIGALKLMNAPRADVVGRPISGVFKSCLDRARQRAPSGQYVSIEQFVAGRWYMVQH